MANWMIDASKLDDEQLEVLDLSPDIPKIVKGCAGSGKTVLAVHKADRIRKKEQGTFYILVYTRALRTFIDDGIIELGIPDTRVLYEWQWRRQGAPEADYLLIDESQDFSAADIALFNKKAKKAVIFFGDTAQQVYPNKIIYENNQRDLTVTIEQIKAITGFDIIQLPNNHRLPESVAKLAQCLLPKHEDIVSNCKKKGGDKPVLKKFNSPSEELDWIINMINNENLKDVGILLPENVQVKLVYEYLEKKRLRAGVRYSENHRVHESLNFTGDTPNIMPYHSSKGLQFETVFLPFCEDTIENYFWQNPFYVAITRTMKSLFFTHSETLSPFFLKFPKDLYQSI